MVITAALRGVVSVAAAASGGLQFTYIESESRLSLASSLIRPLYEASGAHIKAIPTNVTSPHRRLKVSDSFPSFLSLCLYLPSFP